MFAGHFIVDRYFCFKKIWLMKIELCKKQTAND